MDMLMNWLEILGSSLSKISILCLKYLAESLTGKKTSVFHPHPNKNSFPVYSFSYILTYQRNNVIPGLVSPFDKTVSCLILAILQTSLQLNL